VLIATADDLVGVPIAAQLERAGYDVCRAASALESLELLGSHRFVALILDLLVPGGALSALAELRDGGPLRSLPVVLVSPPTLSPIQQRRVYEDVVDTVRRRGSDGPPAADAMRRALAGHHRPAVTTGSR
jgi:CheY-like chemotaxis protein